MYTIQKVSSVSIDVGNLKAHFIMVDNIATEQNKEGTMERWFLEHPINNQNWNCIMGIEME